jgi:hypothetical protein
MLILTIRLLFWIYSDVRQYKLAYYEKKGLVGYFFLLCIHSTIPPPFYVGFLVFPFIMNLL